MKNNQAFLIALAIIIGAGDRLIAAIESGKSPLVIVITGLVGAAIAVKFLMEQWAKKESPNEPITEVRNVIVEGVKGAATEAVTDAISKELAQHVKQQLPRSK